VTRQATDALHLAVKALGRRELSEVELVERLTKAGFSTDDTTTALAELREAGYQSDERAARERARVLAGRNTSDAAIRADLRRRGIDAEMLGAVIGELPPERERAEALAARIGRGRRLLETLTRKGFADETIWAIAGPDIADVP
jgi:SOS response regulatory protein OraA/RecX